MKFLFLGTCSLLRLFPSRFSRNIPSHPAFHNCAGRPSKSEIFMSTYDECCKKAEEILPKHADNETISRVAFHLKQLEIEKENEMKILKMEMEMERKLELQQMKQNQSNAFHAKQLSAVVQRLVVLYVCTLHESVFFLFFRHLPQLPIASSLHLSLCFVFIQTSLREISERCR